MVSDYHPAFEEYCEAIFELHEDDLEVIQARIAERLDVSRPSVSEMIKRMAGEGLVMIEGGIALTEKGMALAEQVVRRHRLAERFLTDILGLSWADAHLEAGKWEHVLSDKVESAIDRLLGGPTTCPHGNPIPGSAYVQPDVVPLASLNMSGDFTITRVTEELEFTPGLLQFLEDNDVQPGRQGNVTALSPDGTVTVRIDSRTVGLSGFAAERILVSPE